MLCVCVQQRIFQEMFNYPQINKRILQGNIFFFINLVKHLNSHAQVCMQTHRHTHTHLHLDVQTCAPICTHTCACTDMPAHTHACAHMHRYAQTCPHTCTHVHVSVHRCAQMCTDTCTQANMKPCCPVVPVLLKFYFSVFFGAN